MTDKEKVLIDGIVLFKRKAKFHRLSPGHYEHSNIHYILWVEITEDGYRAKASAMMKNVHATTMHYEGADAADVCLRAIRALHKDLSIRKGQLIVKIKEATRQCYLAGKELVRLEKVEAHIKKQKKR